jgi:hypothetical protein
MNFSLSLRKRALRGLSGRKKKMNNPHTKVKDPNTKKSSLHEAMAECEWPTP